MELILAVLYYFRQAGKLIGVNQSSLAGNLDPFYLGAPLYIIDNFKNKKRIKEILIISIPIILYSIIQLIFIDDINIMKMAINVSKIIVCLMCMLYARYNYNKINLLLFAKIVSIFYAVSIPISFIRSSSNILWRHNDLVNKYDLSRLNLFYVEPSELGFHTVLIIIILLGYVLASNSIKEKSLLSILIGINIVILLLSKPMGAIVVGVASFSIMILLDLIYNYNSKKLKIYGLIFFILLVMAIIAIINESPIYMRIIDTINGTDSSNSYRIGVSLNVLKESFIDFYGIGCGFGNLNTPQFIGRYADLGLVVVVTNSFIYYIIETGIFGILTLSIGMFILIRACIMSKSVIKWGFLIFLVGYQVFAGHFTSAIYWIIYGIILSEYKEGINDKVIK